MARRMTQRQRLEADEEKLATRDMTPAQLAERRVTRLNDKAERIVTFGALELEDFGALSYAAGIRVQIFVGINTLTKLKRPELAHDLERIMNYSASILAELNDKASEAPPAA